MSDLERIIEGKGGYDYLIRSISIVTLLFERGILHEIFEQGRLSEQEIDERAELIRQRYPGFGEPVAEDAAQSGEEAGQDESFEMD